MTNTINDDLITFNLKQDAIISYTQPVFRIELCQMFYVTSEIVLQRFDFFKDTGHLVFGYLFPIFQGLWLKVNLILHKQFSGPDNIRR